MKKRTYVLLEVLIALTLIVVFSIPLVERPISYLRQERKTLEKMERDRIAEATYCDLKASLLRNEVPWGKIPEKEEPGNFKPLIPLSLDIPGFGKKNIYRCYRIFIDKEKESTSNVVYRLLVVQIHLGSISEAHELARKKKPPFYTYLVFSQKLLET